MRTPLSTLLTLSVCAPLSAQVVQAPFDALYTIANVGPIPGLTGSRGGIAFDREDPNLLLCSMWNTVGVQNLHAIRVVRDAGGHVIGFSGTATPRAQLDAIDGGLAYHPSGVLFYTRYASNFTAANHAVGQLKPGSIVPDRVDPVLGPASVGGLAIVPPGIPGEGRLKTVRWPGGGWTDATLSPDANGTFDLVGEVQTAVLPGGPDGFVYVPRAAAFFNNADVLVAEFNTSILATYAVDTQGDPMAATRQVFATGISSAFALTVDPVTNDIVHAAWSGGGVHVIRGFNLACGPCSLYGTGLAGTGGIEPTITWLGCPLAGELAGVHVGDGQPFGIGGLLVGASQQSIPIFGGTLLNDGGILLLHLLSPSGSFTLPLAIPPGLSPLTLYFQSIYLDAAAVQGISMTNGLSFSTL